LKIDILLSTYNGQAFLEELLRSLENQTCNHWRLLVRDDGSVDNTLQILDAVRKRNPNRVSVLEDQQNHLGPLKSFELLLQNSEADYQLFCDQDDVWIPEKIQLSLEKMQALEKANPCKPAMVFSDLTVTDSHLKKLHNSFWKYTRVNPENIHNVYKLLVNNPVVGCTVMINKAVKSLVLPFPEDALMHDWWTALQISQKGVIDYLPDSTILYRVHDRNTIGAEETNRKYYSRRMLKIRTALNQNKNAIKMLKALDANLSVSKFIFFKTIISLQKLF
jgi:glycosyltransferase involved in cell wall biosynthesis